MGHVRIFLDEERVRTLVVFMLRVLVWVFVCVC